MELAQHNYFLSIVDSDNYSVDDGPMRVQLFTG